jgi:hypothetical protein
MFMRRRTGLLSVELVLLGHLLKHVGDAVLRLAALFQRRAQVLFLVLGVERQVAGHVVQESTRQRHDRLQLELFREGVQEIAHAQLAGMVLPDEVQRILESVRVRRFPMGQQHARFGD